MRTLTAPLPRYKIEKCGVKLQEFGIAHYYNVSPPPPSSSSSSFFITPHGNTKVKIQIQS